ncbi:putative 1-phosphatidylinositol 4-kinase [Dioscorea sansibarensis]
MAPNADSPVQTQMALAVPNHSISSEHHGSRSSEAKHVARRRVFVQTETGCVLGIELDRGDNVHTVKRRLQLALNVPTEESSLTYGDRVLKNDLSAIRNDSPLLLRRNLIQRSSSSPCLSPTAKDLLQRDRSGPIEILGCSNSCSMKQLVKDVVKAIKNGVDPLPVHSGLGGAYYFRNSRGERVAIVKPTDEEPFAPNNPKGFVGKTLGQPGLKRSVRVGETGYREVAAYLLDYDHFANVPPTVLVKITHSIFHVNNEGVSCSKNKPHDVNSSAMSKIASFQQFIPHDFDASDHGTSCFPVAAVHRIGILDIRIFNTDRHAGNLLVKKLGGGDGRFGGQMDLIPIDHGLCLPENLEDPYFEWIHWPQASIPFSDDELKYIADLDPSRDSDMLRSELPMIREACLRVLVLCTIFLKEAAALGLCVAEIGEMMSREFKGGVEEEPSELEMLCIESKRLVTEHGPFLSEAESGGEDDIQFDIDCSEEDELTMQVGVQPSSHSRNPFSKLQILEEEDEDGDEDDTELSPPHSELPQNVSKLSMSLKDVSLAEKHNQLKHQDWFSKGGKTGTKTNYSYGVKHPNGNRSANEQLPASQSFVKLADMSDDQWGAFLEKFQELLPGAFRDRKSRVVGQRQRQRLGTSCQF